MAGRESKVRGRKPKFKIHLDAQGRAELEELQRKTVAPVGEVMRARVILRLDEGQSLKATAKECGFTVRIARKWAWRFLDEGRAGLKERPRPGRKPAFSP